MAEDPRTIHIHQGATYRGSWTWVDNQSTPQPIPLAGFSGRFRLLKRAGGAVIFDFASPGSEAAGLVTLEPGGATGVVQVRLPSAMTTLLTRNCVYELDVISVDDATEVLPVSSGPVTVTKVGG